MPLPKENQDEWKRRIAFKEKDSKKYSFTVKNQEELSFNIIPKILSDKELIFYHAKAHAIYTKSTPPTEEIKNIHTSLIDEFKNRNLFHKEYDGLDTNEKK